MKVEYINPFLVSTISAFDTMLKCALTRGTPYVKNGSNPSHEVSGVIGLSGKAQGTVVVGLGREAALKATEAMLQERPPEINGDVVDAIGELANIIAGRSCCAAGSSRFLPCWDTPTNAQLRNCWMLRPGIDKPVPSPVR